MAALLRIIGGLWLVLVAAGLVVTYGVMWILQGMPMTMPSFPENAPVATLAVIGIAIPGAMLLALAAWLDFRRPR